MYGDKAGAQAYAGSRGIMQDPCECGSARQVSAPPLRHGTEHLPGRLTPPPPPPPDASSSSAPAECKVCKLWQALHRTRNAGAGQVAKVKPLTPATTTRRRARRSCHHAPPFSSIGSCGCLSAKHRRERRPCKRRANRASCTSQDKCAPGGNARPPASSPCTALPIADRLTPLHADFG